MRKNNGHWNDYQNCLTETLKYNELSKFVRGSSGAYDGIIRNGWLDLLTFIKLRKPDGYWNDIENCKREAFKFTSRKQFSILSSYVYKICCKNKWLDDVCGHMEIIGNLYNKCIYSVEFEDNSVYVGLTYNFNKDLFNIKKILQVLYIKN